MATSSTSGRDYPLYTEVLFESLLPPKAMEQNPAEYFEGLDQKHLGLIQKFVDHGIHLTPTDLTIVKMRFGSNIGSDKSAVQLLSSMREHCEFFRDKKIDDLMCGRAEALFSYIDDVKEVIGVIFPALNGSSIVTDEVKEGIEELLESAIREKGLTTDLVNKVKQFFIDIQDDLNKLNTIIIKYKKLESSRTKAVSKLQNEITALETEGKKIRELYEANMIASSEGFTNTLATTASATAGAAAALPHPIVIGTVAAVGITTASVKYICTAKVAFQERSRYYDNWAKIDAEAEELAKNNLSLASIHRFQAFLEGTRTVLTPARTSCQRLADMWVKIVDDLRQINYSLNNVNSTGRPMKVSIQLRGADQRWDNIKKRLKSIQEQL